MKTNKYIMAMMLCSFLAMNGQEIIEDEVMAPKDPVKEVKDGEKIKIDGVSAVVGDFIVLDSDIDKALVQLQNRGSSENYSRCQLFGSLLEDKLYAHHAIQDSIVVNELEIRSYVDQQIAQLVQEIGSMDKLVEYYKMDSEQQLRTEIFEINKNQKLALDMQRKIVEEIEVTPEEVREYFKSIPKDERPIFGTELKVAQIVVIPEITEEAKNTAIKRLEEFRADIVENGASFRTKAVLYSDDTSTKGTGGQLPPMNKKKPQMVKEFREVAFSLQEGEISEPFETQFGYHIIQLDRIRGQEYDVRHILLRPQITDEAIQLAKEEINKAREAIIAGDVTFKEAALEFSDEKETKFEGGQLVNPLTQDFNFELTKMEPELYAQIQNLKDGEVSPIYQDEDRINTIKYKILMVTDRIDEHEADFARDYLKIKNLAEQEKQIEAIAKWQDEKILDTYIKINGSYRDCEFNSNWLKQ